MALDIRKIELEIGLDAPVKLLHISDVHLSYADERDDARKRELAARRRMEFAQGGDGCIEKLREAIAYARANGDFLVHTGDMIDFVSYQNLEIAQREMRDEDWFFIAGNHEFSKYVGEAFEDEAYKRDSLPLVQKHFKDDVLFHTRVVGGVNLVGIDDTYYHFIPEHRARLEAEIQKGLPIVLLTHDPFYSADLPEDTLYYVCAPEKMLATYSEHRRIQQTPTPEDRAFFDFLLAQPLIKLVLAGHMHERRENRLDNGVMQYIPGGLFKGLAQEVILK